MVKINKKVFKVLWFAFIVIIGLAVYMLPKFINTDYYINRNLAFIAVQGKTYFDGVKASAQHLNPIYVWYNMICQIWGWLVTLFTLTLFFKVESFKQIDKLFGVNNKKFLYLWVNLSYLLWCFLSVVLYINDLKKEVYDSYHDTLAIPLFQLACQYVYFSAIFYPLSNIILFFTYNNKRKSIWIILVLLFAILYIIANTYIHFMEKFAVISIFMNAVNIVWFVLCINILKMHLRQWEILRIIRK